MYVGHRMSRTPGVSLTSTYESPHHRFAVGADTNFRGPLARYNMMLASQLDRERTHVVFTKRRMKTEGVKPDRSTYNCLLQAYVQERLYAEARGIFEDMVAMGMHPDKQSFHYLMETLRPHEQSAIFDVIKMMGEWSVLPNEYTYEIITTRFAETQRLELALQFLAKLGPAGLFPRIEDGHLCHHLALDLADPYESHPYEHHFAPVVEAMYARSEIKEPFILLDFRRKNDMAPTLDTASLVLAIISKDTDTVDGGKLEEIRENGEVVDPVALNVVIQTAVALKALQRAVCTCKAAAQVGLKPNVDTFNLLLEGCIYARHCQLGDRFLSDLKNTRVKVDVRTYKHMMLLCLTRMTYEDAFFYLEEMKALRMAIIRKLVSVGADGARVLCVLRTSLMEKVGSVVVRSRLGAIG
ncbi:hypothetical protein BD310DRAFT_946458 [Dichomitus squalens]|uniref:Pentatricopeptide repeat-containing protein-mitochondrial domain-containing protein n=1 Tax=Dichomitus squalens TaxID=114155 RepID=A0A4V2K8X3_9APHY|nr:hypothetical protein BD310DRAFT_946458 [Dichomitus squalens]